MKDKHKLIDLQLHKEETEHSVGWYLSAIYQHENDVGVYEVTIPKIWLPVKYGDPIFKVPIHHREETTINIGFGDLIVLRDDQGHAYYEKLIEEKIHNMTLDEIEKKLGFKVRVVSKKEMSEQ